MCLGQDFIVLNDLWSEAPTPRGLSILRPHVHSLSQAEDALIMKCLEATKLRRLLSEHLSAVQLMPDYRHVDCFILAATRFLTKYIFTYISNKHDSFSLLLP